MQDVGIGSWPTRRARMTPGKVSVVDRGVSKTYAEIAASTNRLAHGLRALGVQRGDRVAYLGFNATTLIETLFATAKAGAVFLPLNTRLAPPEWTYILADSGATVVIWDEPFGEALSLAVQGLPEAPRLVSVTGEAGQTSLDEVRALGSDEPLDLPIGLDDLYMLQYTSGTTGHPKGVMMSHGNVTWNTTNFLIDVDLGGDEVALVVGPLFHTAALNQQFMSTFLKGGTQYIERKWDVERAFDMIEEHRVTFFWGPPVMYTNLLQSPRWAKADLSSLRTLQCGGAPFPEPMLKAYAERGLAILQGYGLTEASPGTTMLRADDSFTRIGSAGTSCFFTDVRVVDERGEPVPVGGTGEIQIQGFNVTSGYWRKPQATEETILPGGWLRTGDLARVEEGGFLYIVDRLKDMIISGGENVYPAEVEEALHSHPAVADVAVIGVPDERWGEVPRAVVVLREGMQATEQELLDHLRGLLARYKIPKSIVLTESLARNASGKLLKVQIRETYGAS